MPDLESIITAQVEAAGGGEGIASPDVDTSDDVDTTPDTDTTEVETEGDTTTVETTEEKPPVETDTTTAEIDPTTGKPKVEAKPVEKDELTKELEALGLKEPKEGERENRLPFKRVKKITENYGKKVEARVRAEYEPLKTEVESLRGTAATVKNVDRLIATDPDRYMDMLVGIHPAYKKFLGGAKVDNGAAKVDKDGKPVETKAVTDLGPRPAADHKFEDGSMGYTPEQHEKLLDWVAAKAKADALTEARAELDQRFKPIDDERKSREDYNKRVDGVKAEAGRIRDAYGADVVKKYETQIVEHMKKNPTMSATQASREIIMPALQADRNKMRTELLVETGERPKAAKVGPVAQAKDTETDEPTTIEGVIGKAIAGLKR